MNQGKTEYRDEQGPAAASSPTRSVNTFNPRSTLDYRDAMAQPNEAALQAIRCIDNIRSDMEASAEAVVRLRHEQREERLLAEEMMARMEMHYKKQVEAAQKQVAHLEDMLHLLERMLVLDMVMSLTTQKDAVPVGYDYTKLGQYLGDIRVIHRSDNGVYEGVKIARVVEGKFRELTREEVLVVRDGLASALKDEPAMVEKAVTASQD